MVGLPATVNRLTVCQCGFTDPVNTNHDGNTDVHVLIQCWVSFAHYNWCTQHWIDFIMCLGTSFTGELWQRHHVATESLRRASGLPCALRYVCRSNSTKLTLQTKTKKHCLNSTQIPIEQVTSRLPVLWKTKRAWRPSVQTKRLDSSHRRCCTRKKSHVVPNIKGQLCL